MGFPHSSVGNESACNARDLGSIAESERSPGEGNGNSLKYSSLKNPMDKGAWQATVHGVTVVGHYLATETNKQTKKQCHTPYSRFPPEIPTKRPLDLWSWPSKGTPGHLWSTVSLMSGCVCHATPENTLWIIPWTYSALKHNTHVPNPGPDPWTSCSFTEFLSARSGSLRLDPIDSMALTKGLKLNINKGLWKVGLG